MDSNPINWERLCYFQWPEISSPSIGTHTPKKHVGIKPVGTRWGIWPLYFEEYYGDIEPILKDSDPTRSAPNRIFVWNRLHRADTPSGWGRIPFEEAPLRFGYQRLNEKYRALWNPRIRNRYNHWKSALEESRYVLASLSFDEFASAQALSTVAKEAPTLLSLQKRQHQFPDAVHLWGIKQVTTGEVMAGLAAIDSLEQRASYYSHAFYRKEAAKDRLMIPLIDMWCVDSLRRNLSLLHFGSFTKNERAGTQRGRSISEFKAQFGLEYFSYQPPLYRLVRGRFFPRRA